jgi:hypothetical protein
MNLSRVSPITELLPWGNGDGEDDYEAAAVDERGHSYAHVDGARQDKDNCDCAQTQADCASDISEGDEAGRDDAGRLEEEGVKWSW